MFNIKTPKGQSAPISGGGITGSARLQWSSGFGRRKSSSFTKAQRMVDSECLRLCSPKVPFRNGALEGSGQIHTNVGSGEIIYRTPYARRWYYESANFNGAPERGNQWFERMKRQSGKAILKKAGGIIGD